MNQQAECVAEVSQDNYGRWFVEARQGARKLAPIGCFSEREARVLADRFASSAERRDAA